MSGLKTIIEFVMDILETVVFIGSLFIVVYLFILQPNQVKGASMDPTFNSGDYIFTSKITYKFRQPERGDVVVFKSPKNPDIEYIKRIIAIPGDSVSIKDGQVFVNGSILNENYINVTTNTWEGGFVKEGVLVTVPQNYLFVLGDNRPRSSDSREFGPIPLSSIIGQVFYRYFPASKMGTINNPFPKSFHSTLNIYNSFITFQSAN
ncbi:MAG: signal peptidase I [Candidatus Roizmanbacteria bacterium]|nr:MAG: signal peptidase I [Candidatus Roizmanbacteria bacterium]